MPCAPSRPLPAPQILGQFNEIVPGAAERLITTAETEGEHRRSMERRFLKYSFWRELLGVGSGTIVSIVLIAMAAYVATYNTTVASFMASSSFVSAIAVILNKRAGSEQEEQEEQSKPNNNKEGDNLEEEVESKKASLPE
ncbi:MAG: DUF2335 domain-containing protein [Nitrospinaceae bacterium]|nr:DUF2335 domain-containing protein [Nitrospinaceae bacterium]